MFLPISVAPPSGTICSFGSDIVSEELELAQRFAERRAFLFARVEEGWAQAAAAAGPGDAAERERLLDRDRARGDEACLEQRQETPLPRRRAGRVARHERVDH